ncbi:MAG: PEP-CTERM sorting domain-containing protein [Alteromonadaceae bacterium]|nr:PEP-CTERM sorting domain-containing protein [Alteromonadaceae bacterium]
MSKTHLQPRFTSVFNHLRNWDLSSCSAITSLGKFLRSAACISAKADYSIYKGLTMTRLFIKALVPISLILSFNLKADIITVNLSGTLNFNSDSSSGTDVIGLDGVNIYTTSIFKAADTPDRTDILTYPIDKTITNVTWYSKLHSYYTDSFLDGLGNPITLGNSYDVDNRRTLDLSYSRFFAQNRANYDNNSDAVIFYSGLDRDLYHISQNAPGTSYRFYLPSLHFDVGPLYFGYQDITLDSFDFNDLSLANLRVDDARLSYNDGSTQHAYYSLDNVSFEISALDDNEETILPEPASLALTGMALLATFSLRRRKKFDKFCSIA